MNQLEETKYLNVLNATITNKEIYTRVGDLLIALKPSFDHSLFSDAVLEKYKPERNITSDEVPHIFDFARDAVTSMKTDTKQCIIVRGDSGSGKSTSVQLLIKYWAHYYSCNEVAKNKTMLMLTIVENLTSVFTPKNKNSTKSFLTYNFSFSDSKICGIKVGSFLLDKWRLTDQPSGESNFNILYLMLFGIGQDFKSKRRMLSNSDVVASMDGSLLLKKYNDLMTAFSVLGFSTREQNDISLILTTLLGLADIEFKRSKFQDVAVGDSSKSILKTFSEILGLDSSELEEKLLTTSIISSGEEVKKHFTRDEAEDNLNQIIRVVYSRLFAWILHQINIFLRFKQVDESERSPLKELFVVDTRPIVGEEEDADLPDFLNNFTQEFLQYLYEEHLIVKEEELLADEVNVSVAKISQKANLTDDFLGENGYLSIIGNNEHMGDSNLLEKLLKRQEGSQTSKVESKKEKSFILTHFNNSEIKYNVFCWNSKNEDYPKYSVTQFFSHAENTLMSLLFKGKISTNGEFVMPRQNSGKKMKLPSIEKKSFSEINILKNSLQILLTKMSESHLRFVLCINKNLSQRISSSCDGTQYYRVQLKNWKVLESMYLLENAFSSALSFDDFNETFSPLLSKEPSGSSTKNATNKKELLMSILEKFPNIRGYIVGKSKIFLKFENLKVLNNLLLQNHTLSVKETINLETPPPLPVARQSKIATSTVVAVAGAGSAAAVPASDITKKNIVISPKAESSMKLYPSLDIMNCEYSSDEDFEDVSKLAECSRREAIKIYGEIGSRQASVKWFKATQTDRVKDKNKFYEWFHGIITRTESEKLLKDKPTGCFLIRVAESRLGYTLSFKSETRFRHYMIDELGNKKFTITGDGRQHDSLVKLVEFHKLNKISNWNRCLGVPCPQNTGSCDYLELIPTQEDLNMWNSKAPLAPSAPGEHYITHDFVNQFPRF